MYIIEVIPISRGMGADTLSYFTTKSIALGDIVEVPVRNKKIPGIVINIREAEDLKGEIKTAGYALKKIEKIRGTKFFAPYFMEMVSSVADYYATSAGSIINILVPAYILENISKLKTTKSLGSVQEKLHEVCAVQGDDEERYGNWKSLIRQEFARKKSVLMIYPTVEDAIHAFSLLEKGISDYIFLLHGSLSEKEIIVTWNKIMDDKHPVAVITTGGFLSLPRTDIETIVVEVENSKSYKIPRRPYLDIRNVCEIYARKRNIKLYFADIVLRIETLWREHEGQITQSSLFKSRSLSTATDILIDMKQYKGSSFKVLGTEVEELITRTKEASEHMIILANRKGVAPTTICGDCQNTVLCNKCSAPVVLYKDFFMCHRCGERRKTSEYCKVCSSWKLSTQGIGIDLIVEKIGTQFPNITVFKMDGDSIKTSKVARTLMQKFRAQPGSVLVGTEMMLQYLHEKVENSAIISLDSLFALPDFRIQEKILYLLIRMRAYTSANFIVQTRADDLKVFEYGLKGNMSDFYKMTIAERKNFNYPPFTTLIKITLEGKKDSTVKSMEGVQNALDPHEVEVFPAFTHTIKGNFVLHGLLRLSSWPNPDLVDRLRALSRAVAIKVDPETLL